MAQGKVRWFDARLGYGFIQQGDGSPDIFVHFTALDMSGLKELTAGMAISFEPSRDSGVMRATNLRLDRAT
ncbi:MAG: cold-shock protein [Alphaproteobacteria bacterium]|nr:cold-shock protein [Alphaproteobacteria bacterium]